jgi:hypothetical protein
VVGAGSVLARVQDQVPFAATMIGAFVQVAPVTLTVEPGVPVPVIGFVVVVIGLMTGAGGL